MKFFHKNKIVNLGKEISVSKIIFNSLTLLISLSFTCFTPFTSALPSPEVHVDGYQELEEPFYPFQQYIQVRKTYTVEHVPLYDESPSANLDTSASNSNSKHPGDDPYTTSASSAGGGGEGESHYQVPRLREEIHDYKKHEVYEEKGYGDSDYDHRSYGHRSKADYNSPPPDYDDHQQGASSNSDASTASSSTHGWRRYRTRKPSLHTPDGSSTKILEYAATHLHDKEAQRKGIYAARANIYCPEVIDFDLSSKSMKMGEGGRGGAKPRLRGLGSKIKCLKERYFGREPLPKAIFDDPSESRHAVIEIPTFDNFFRMVKDDIHSSSSFQNSRVPF